MSRPQRYGTFDAHPDDQPGVETLANYGAFIMDETGRVREMWLNRRFADTDVPLLASLPLLKILGYCGLKGSPDAISPDGIVEAFATFQLSSLILQNHDQVDDDTLGRLATNYRLQELRIYNSEITDRGIALFESHAKLTAFGVNGQQITDSSASSLCQHPNLGYAYFGRTSVTTKGLDALQMRLPKCKIEVKR
jgi:hypothetical protein